jgi:predicted aspartyl protease
VTLDSLEVGDARVAPLAVVAYYIQLREGDGLLGRDFLDRFRVTVDGDARLVILTPR